MVGGRSWGMVTILVVLDKRLVRTGDSLILDISMVLLVLIHKVVNNLGSAVRELHSVLTYNTTQHQFINRCNHNLDQNIIRGLQPEETIIQRI